jgi:hypothetical protein
VFSNSKLTAEQKAHRKQLLAKYPLASWGVSGGVTVMLYPAGNVQRMVTSIASFDEKKLRRKVGEYNCLLRFDCEMFVVVPEYVDAQDMAEYL